MSNKRKKDARISSVELKSLGLKNEEEEEDEAPRSEKKKEKTDKAAAQAAPKKGTPESGLKQSKISDFVGDARRVQVSFDGRLESFTHAELAILATFLQAKAALNKPQLALAVEVWNTNPAPDTFQFRGGENEGRSITLADLLSPASDIEHVMFREKGASKLPTLIVNLPPPPAPRTHKKK